MKGEIDKHDFNINLLPQANSLENTSISRIHKGPPTQNKINKIN